jgi:hypothetical protein
MGKVLYGDKAFALLPGGQMLLESIRSYKMEDFPNVADAERDLVGAVLYDELAFERAKLPSSEFYIQRWRWVWEACEKIKAADDHIDLGTLEKELEKAGHLKEVTERGDLMEYFVPTPAACGNQCPPGTRDGRTPPNHCHSH